MKHSIYIIAAMVVVASGFSLPMPATAQGMSQSCPPGLARKNPPCVPPGLARQGMTEAEWRGRYREGDYVEQNQIRRLEDYSPTLSQTLPKLRRTEMYGVVDNGLVVMDRESSRIQRLIGILNE